MKVEVHYVEKNTLEAFADEHDLTVVVYEREPELLRLPRIGPNARFFAEFQCCEVKEGRVLCSYYGDGPTPEAAMEDYARRISGKLLVMNAYSPTRKEIQAPHFTGVR